MLYIRLMITVLVLSLSISLTQSAEKRIWRGVPVRVIDGDTIRIKRQDEEIRVRLYGIDCPEKDLRYSRQVKAFVEEAIDGKTLAVEELYLDRYKRSVCIITVDGRVLNRELVAAGLAWVYPLYCTDKVLCDEWRNDEIQAREKALGIWSLESAPTPPWRHRKHGRR